MKSYEDLTDQIEAFWSKEEDRQGKSWTGHEDINAVMLATSLAPDTFLEVYYRSNGTSSLIHAKLQPSIVRVSQASAGIACGLELVALKEVLDAIDVECLRR